MSKRCCRCRCCGCCCGRRAATVLVSVVGLLLAAAAIAPPAYIYHTDGDYNKLFPPLRMARQFLMEATHDIEAREGGGGGGGYVGGGHNMLQEEITVVESIERGSTLVEIQEERTPRDKYK